jgi:hypothetical protein
MTPVWRGNKIDHQNGDHDDWATACTGAIWLASAKSDVMVFYSEFLRRAAQPHAARGSYKVRRSGPRLLWFRERTTVSRLMHASFRIAFDRASVRTKSQDGHLHVASSAVSSAQVNDYLGSEIPHYREFGLRPDRVYALLRDPFSLEKAVPSLHGKPLVIRRREQQRVTTTETSRSCLSAIRPGFTPTSWPKSRAEMAL